MLRGDKVTALLRADAAAHALQRVDTETDSDDIAEILRLTRETHANIAAIRKVVDDIAPEILPVVEQLTNSPMFRMFAGKGKK